MIAIASFRPAFRTLFRRFGRNESGAYAPLFAVLAVPLIGGVGLGVDTLRFQNAQAALIQGVELTCKRAASGDQLLYPRMSDRVNQAQTFVNEALANKALDPRGTQITVSTDGESIKVEGRTVVKMTLMSLIGPGTRAAGSSSSCKPITGALTENCKDAATMVGDLEVFEIDAFHMRGKATDFVVSRFDARNELKERVLIGKKKPMTRVRFKNPGKGDYALIQELDADGAIPAACNT